MAVKSVRLLLALMFDSKIVNAIKCQQAFQSIQWGWFMRKYVL